RLIEKSDVLIYNVRPQAMARLDLGYDVVSKRNPRLVYGGVFGFGQEGPYAAKPAYDDLIQGATGLPALMAQTSDGMPRYVPNALVDRIVGLTAWGVPSSSTCPCSRPWRASCSAIISVSSLTTRIWTRAATPATSRAIGGP